MTETGWIKIHRKITTSWLYKDPEYLKAWITILIEVNHEPQKVLIQKTLLNCGRGESLKSLSTWGKLFGNWGKDKTVRFFNLLEKDEKITTRSERITTRLTVCNYETYQDGQYADQPSHQPRINPQTDRGPTTNKNDKNEKKNIKKINKENADLEMFTAEFPFLQIQLFKKAFQDHLSGKKVSKTEQAVRARLTKLHDVSIENAIKALNDAIDSDWAGVFPKQNNQGSNNGKFKSYDQQRGDQYGEIATDIEASLRFAQNLENSGNQERTTLRLYAK